MEALLRIGSVSGHAPPVFALVVQGMCNAMLLANRIAIRNGEVGRLYESGVIYREEPPGIETFRDAVDTAQLGYGDCAHLASWRCAELQELDGEPASLRIDYEPSIHDPEQMLYHVYVRRGFGEDVFEDPSRNLGMP